MADHLHETDSLEIEVDLPSGSAIESPGVLQGIERISDALSRVEGLGRARSIVDAVRWTNRLVHGDRPGFESIPDSPEANAELFLLLSFEADRILDTWVSLDRRHARISVEAEMESQAHQSAILAEVERLLAAELPKGWKASLNGPLWVRHALVGEIQRTQLWSFAAAGAAVFVLLAGFLGSISWAVMAMIPSVLPVMATLGAMGAADIPLDIGGAMVAAVVLGIAVDDTIYLLASYRTRRRRGRPPAVAIRGAVLQVGRAITTTSLALALGFLALTLSHLQSIAHFGILAGIAIVAAWVADLVLLPALLLSLSREPSAAGDSWPDSESDANAKQGGA